MEAIIAKIEKELAFQKKQDKEFENHFTQFFLRT